MQQQNRLSGDKYASRFAAIIILQTGRCRLITGQFLKTRCRALTAELQKRIQAVEMRCYRKILRISYKDHVANEKVRAKIQQAIGPHEDLLAVVKRRKLQ